MPHATTSATKTCGEQASDASEPEGPFRELAGDLTAVLSNLTSEPPHLASQRALLRDAIEQVFAGNASVSEDPDERHNQLLLMRGHLMTLLGAAGPVDEDDRSFDEDDLVVRVRALLGEEIPGDAARAASLHRSMAEAARELLVSLPDSDVSHEVAGARAVTVHAGFDSTRIREGVRSAKSWKQAGVYPHPHTLTAVTRALSGHITTLVPYVSIYSETLTLGSQSRVSCREAIERAQEARDAPLGEGLHAAREHAFRLAVHTGALLRYAEQCSERGGE
ncbi:DUF6415 family natural product biosynthesis protein [Streptomyces sp. A30]|uniref:DUF6415 family natural product biosynthesis protein n=1 Tax=Streptomyces sp. A30 TaxID=2789273 RepID=UPI00397FD7E3